MLHNLFGIDKSRGASWLLNVELNNRKIVLVTLLLAAVSAIRIPASGTSDSLEGFFVQRFKVQCIGKRFPVACLLACTRQWYKSHTLTQSLPQTDSRIPYLPYSNEG